MSKITKVAKKDLPKGGPGAPKDAKMTPWGTPEPPPDTGMDGHHVRKPMLVHWIKPPGAPLLQDMRATTPPQTPPPPAFGRLLAQQLQLAVAGSRCELP